MRFRRADSESGFERRDNRIDSISTEAGHLDTSVDLSEILSKSEKTRLAQHHRSIDLSTFDERTSQAARETLQRAYGDRKAIGSCLALALRPFGCTRRNRGNTTAKLLSRRPPASSCVG